MLLGGAFASFSSASSEGGGAVGGGGGGGAANAPPLSKEEEEAALVAMALKSGGVADEKAKLRKKYPEVGLLRFDLVSLFFERPLD